MSIPEFGTTHPITLALVSHTNVGKTTLARTLLRRDVGEVLDQAHVTELSEAHELITTQGAALRLYDTPGFGDSVRLLRRLRREGTPVVWFLQQTWDRWTDRPLWCSQQAMLTIRDETDVVLYLVNAAETPEDAGYVVPELELLTWIGRPVLLLLNQTGESAFQPGEIGRYREAWTAHVAPWPVVKDVLHLDAFNRNWLQESQLFAHVAGVLPVARQPLMKVLLEAWDTRNLSTFDRAIMAVANYLASAARERERMTTKRPSSGEKRQAMEALTTRLVEATEALMASLIAEHGLEGSPAAELEKMVDSFAVEGEEALDPERGALLGGVVSGALSGLAADLMSGGLSFGGGMVAGAILGALGGAGLARGYQLARGERWPEVRWTEPFWEQLAAQGLLRYLAVAHFGRGRGPFETFEHPERWRDAVQATIRGDEAAWSRAWKQAAAEDETPNAVIRLVDRSLRRVLVKAYPNASAILHR